MMTSRLMPLVGTLLCTTLLCGSARALQPGAAAGAAPAARPQAGLGGQPQSDYRYSGNNFNFSMSRNPSAAHNHAPAPGIAPMDAEGAKSRPGLFRRIIRDIFGED